MNTRLSGHDRKKLAERIKADIDAYCVQKFDEPPRAHLGASIIGKKCQRELVYGFRHMHRKRFDGRMLRLFNRGHKEEFRFVEWLRGIEAKVWELSEDGKQFRMSYVDGHYGGSLDGIAVMPERYMLDFPFLLEMKTHNDRSFKRLVKDSVRMAKPEHWQQMCNYGYSYELQYAIYMAVNKNDDDLHIEVLELDHNVGKANVEKAMSTVGADTLPPKIAANPSYDSCKYCDMSGICHSGEPVDVNCRSCSKAVAVADAQWFCRHWNAIIPKDVIPNACPQWSEFGK